MASSNAPCERRARLGLSVLSAFIFLLVLAGCSGTRPVPARTASPTPPPHDPPDCACTLEYRYNVCIGVNGADSLPPGLTVIREREDGTVDLLESHPRCFGEWRGGLQRILALRAGAAVDSSGWFETPTVDCCHGAAKTVNFNIPSAPQ